MNPEQIVAIASGTAGLTAFLIFLHFRDRGDHQKELAEVRARHDKQIADERLQRDREIADSRARLDASLVDNRAQTAANERLADTVEKLVTRDEQLSAAIEGLTRAMAKP